MHSNSLLSLCLAVYHVLFHVCVCVSQGSKICRVELNRDGGGLFEVIDSSNGTLSTSNGTLSSGLRDAPAIPGVSCARSPDALGSLGMSSAGSRGQVT